MREYGFELALCAHLECEDRLVSRQLGGHVHGRRILDTVVLEPGPEFDERAAITSRSIPGPALEADVSVGKARPVSECFPDLPPERAEQVVERAAEIGFFDRERRGGSTVVRQTAPYPDRWFDRIVAVENKPDLDRPGDLYSQLRRDIALGLCEEVVLATRSYVTGAHLNRIPEEVGVWRFDPETGEREVIRQATPLDPGADSVEILAEHPGRTEITTVDADAKRRARRRLAERAYGKGWRTFDLPACARCQPADGAPAATVPYCAWHDRIVDPASECGQTCPGYERADQQSFDPAAERAARTRWESDPAGRRRRQAGLDRFG